MELGQAVVGDLLRGEGLGDHADDLAPLRPSTASATMPISPTRPAAEDEPDPRAWRAPAPTARPLGVGGEVPEEEPQKTQMAGTMFHAILVGQVSQPDFLILRSSNPTPPQVRLGNLTHRKTQSGWET